MVRNSLRRYLLNQLSDAEQKAVELELLSDETSLEELEIAEDELVDEYVANDLSRKERKQFETFFLAHEARKRKLQAAEAFKRHFGKVSPTSSPRKKPGFFEKWFNPFSLSPAISIAATIVVVAALGTASWRLFFYQSTLQKGLIALDEAYSQERPVEARLSERNYAPYNPTRGGPGEVNTLEQRRAEFLLSEAFSEKPNADSQHALGQMYLWQRQFDKAIEYLTQAKRADANNPGIYADLGAAYLEKGKLDPNLGPSQGAFALSLENLNRALELKPDLREALFNRALVYQYQGQKAQEESDWRAYLSRDSESQWAAEARKHLQRLEATTP